MTICVIIKCVWSFYQLNTEAVCVVVEYDIMSLLEKK